VPQHKTLPHKPGRQLAAGFALLAFMPLNAPAAGMVLTGEVAFGGDDLTVVSGGEDLQAGQLLNLGIGYDFDLNPAKTLLLRAGINYKFDSVDASNGEADFDRWPLDLILVSRQGNFSLGAGITYHLSPSYEATINGFSTEVDFDDALGFLLQAGVMVTPTMELGARVTMIEYEPAQPTVMFPSLTPIDKVDGDSFGIYVTIGF
jgi:hypothetical protein